ncbi:MAG: tail fiber domain-containing protein, partial [Candidatus Mariimomonas ferrooxydans]
SEEPVYLFGAASTSTQNFVAFGGGSTIGNAATQLDLFTASNTTTPAGTPRLTIIGNGNVGIGTQSPSYPLHMASGAYVTAGGTWTNASSREYKENINVLTAKQAIDTLKELSPVTFNYKADKQERYAGFIAEDVPALVAMNDRKGLSPMDIVAVLTSVVKEQQEIAQQQQKTIAELVENKLEQQKTITELSRKVAGIEREVKLKGSLAMAD